MTTTRMRRERKSLIKGEKEKKKKKKKKKESEREDEETEGNERKSGIELR